jgi:hypothetical protein
MELHDLLHDVFAELRRDDERATRERTKGLERVARAFLEQLDPESQEGMWFDAFAASFPSRLDAAIAYVEGR